MSQKCEQISYEIYFCDFGGFYGLHAQRVPKWDKGRPKYINKLISERGREKVAKRGGRRIHKFLKSLIAGKHENHIKQLPNWNTNRYQ